MEAVEQLGYSGLSDMGKVWWEMSELGEFCLSHFKFGMPIRYPSGDSSWEMDIRVQREDSLGLEISLQVTCRI